MMEPMQTPAQRDEARLELGMAASAAERANQPRWMIFVGVLLLLGACAFTLWAWGQRSSALAAANAERAKTKRLVDIRNQLEAESAKLAARATPPDPRTGQHIEQLAADVGIGTPPTVTDQVLSGMSVGGMQQRKYTARLMSEDPLNVFNWLTATQTSPLTPGLEISRLVLRPGSTPVMRPAIVPPGMPGATPLPGTAGAAPPGGVQAGGAQAGVVQPASAGSVGAGTSSGGWYAEVEFTRWEKTK